MEGLANNHMGSNLPLPPKGLGIPSLPEPTTRPPPPPTNSNTTNNTANTTITPPIMNGTPDVNQMNQLNQLNQINHNNQVQTNSTPPAQPIINTNLPPTIVKETKKVGEPIYESVRPRDESAVIPAPILQQLNGIPEEDEDKSDVKQVLIQTANKFRYVINLKIINIIKK